MTILDFWYFVAKSFKKFAGGKEKASVKVGVITKITKTIIVQAISYLSWCIWTIGDTPLDYKLSYTFIMTF